MKRDDFDKSVHQLLNLLQKILKNHSAGPSINQLFDSKNFENIVFNLCFFNFIPMTPEELDEFEEAFNSAHEQELHSDHSPSTDQIDHFGWNEKDDEFLKQHGIKL